MATRVSIFNLKDDVGKTTTAFNLSWAMASKGKRVVLADFDPQCGLTDMVFGFKGMADLEGLYKAAEANNVRDALARPFRSSPLVMVAATCQEVPGRPDLFLLPGHIGLAEQEGLLAMAQQFSGSAFTLRDLPGSISYLLDKTAEKYKADYVIVDMGPGLGPMNENLLMTSDFFLVPMTTDCFSVMATESLATVLPIWRHWSVRTQQRQVVLDDLVYPYPTRAPKFLGTIVRKRPPREGRAPSKGPEAWIDELEFGAKALLLPALRKNEMLLPDEAYADDGVLSGRPFLQTSDFEGLIALSRKHQAPVFDLTDHQLEQAAAGIETTKKSMEEFRRSYSEGADKAIAMTTNAIGA